MTSGSRPTPNWRAQPVDLVFAGGGTLVVSLVATYFALHRLGLKVARVGGVSAGSLAALCVAYGLSEDQAKRLLKNILGSGKDLLDESIISPFTRYGVHKGDALHAYIQRTFPEKLDGARIPLRIVTYDIDAECPIVFDSERCPDVRVADVAMASCSIPLWFGVRRITSVPGRHSDGGQKANFPMDLFDDVPTRRTIGIRFKSPLENNYHFYTTQAAYPRLRPARDLPDAVGRHMKAIVNNLNHTHVSSKRWQNVIDIETSGNGLDFTLSEAEIESMWQDGDRTAMAWAKLQAAETMLR